MKRDRIQEEHLSERLFDRASCRTARTFNVGPVFSFFIAGQPFLGEESPDHAPLETGAAHAGDVGGPRHEIRPVGGWQTRQFADH
jgi:hypothetical protein